MQYIHNNISLCGGNKIREIVQNQLYYICNSVNNELYYSIFNISIHTIFISTSTLDGFLVEGS